MNRKRFATIFASLALVTLPSIAHALLELTLDSGLGTQTFTDMDDNGEVDFDVTVDGIFQAKGTAKADLDSLKEKLPSLRCFQTRLPSSAICPHRRRPSPSR